MHVSDPARRHPINSSQPTYVIRRSTPWLTKNKRTCPLCKSDVVRSLTSRAPALSFRDDPAAEAAENETYDYEAVESQGDLDGDTDVDAEMGSPSTDWTTRQDISAIAELDGARRAVRRRDD